MPNLKPQIRGEAKTVSANYIFVPDESLRQITLNSLASVICEICGYLLSSVFGLSQPAPIVAQITTRERSLLRLHSFPRIFASFATFCSNSFCFLLCKAGTLTLG